MIQTDDLFLGAYALMRGGELQDVEVRGMNGRRTAVFRIDGLEEAKREYYGGEIVVNLQLLKLELKRLKDRAFDVRSSPPTTSVSFLQLGVLPMSSVHFVTYVPGPDQTRT